MENATKALLIAAAVLVAILIISLGVGVYNMASESMQNVNLDAQEVQAHNDKFLNYIGDVQRGSTVNTMLRTVFNHNITETNAAKKIAVSGAATLTTGATSAAKEVDTGKTYKVEATYAKTGLITSIKITEIK